MLRLRLTSRSFAFAKKGPYHATPRLDSNKPRRCLTMVCLRNNVQYYALVRLNFTLPTQPAIRRCNNARHSAPTMNCSAVPWRKITMFCRSLIKQCYTNALVNSGMDRHRIASPHLALVLHSLALPMGDRETPYRDQNEHRLSATKSCFSSL